MVETFAFYIFAVLTVVSFTITVMSNHALYALSAMAAGSLFVSAFYFINDADFMGAIQIVVYTGAIMALYAFGMMFFDTTRTLYEKINAQWVVFVMTVTAVLLVIVIVIAPSVGASFEASYPIDTDVPNPQMVGMVLFTKYLVPFELAAVMLLVAMIAGIVLAGKKMDRSLTLMKEEDILIMQEKNREVGN